MAERGLFEIDGGIAATLHAELALFTGTANYYRNWQGLLYTDGIRYLANRAGAYWLVDAIASWQPHLGKIARESQEWRLSVDDQHVGELHMVEDYRRAPVICQKIEYTDFPLSCITLHVVRNVLFLPSES